MRGMKLAGMGKTTGNIFPVTAQLHQILMWMMPIDKARRMRGANDMQPFIRNKPLLDALARSRII